MPGNLENTSMATGPEMVNFTLIPKMGSVKKCSNYCTVVHISYAGKVMLKIPQPRFQQLEKEMATHSSVLTWRIPGTGELGGLPFMGSYGVGHD